MSISSFTATDSAGDGLSWKESIWDAFVSGLSSFLNTEVVAKAPDKTSTETVTGNWTFTGVIALNGDLKLNRTARGAGSYTMTNDDVIIAKTSITGGGDTVNLMAAAIAGAGRVVIIKDESGTAATRNITIDGNSSETIDGASTYVINGNYGIARLYCNGSNWFTF